MQAYRDLGELVEAVNESGNIEFWSRAAMMEVHGINIKHCSLRHLNWEDFFNSD